MKKTIIYSLLIVALALSVTVILLYYNNNAPGNGINEEIGEPSVNNYNYEDQLAAEKHAISHFLMFGAELYSVEETIYDTDSDRYIVHLKGYEDYNKNIEKMLILGVTNGKVSSIDLGDGKGEYTVYFPVVVDEGTPIDEIEEVAPGIKAYVVTKP